MSKVIDKQKRPSNAEPTVASMREDGKEEGGARGEIKSTGTRKRRRTSGNALSNIDTAPPQRREELSTLMDKRSYKRKKVEDAPGASALRKQMPIARGRLSGRRGGKKAGGQARGQLSDGNDPDQGGVIATHTKRRGRGTGRVLATKRKGRMVGAAVIVKLARALTDLADRIPYLGVNDPDPEVWKKFNDVLAGVTTVVGIRKQWLWLMQQIKQDMLLLSWRQVSFYVLSAARRACIRAHTVPHFSRWATQCLFGPRRVEGFVL